MTTIKITPKVSTVYEVGAILSDSWGYEQTNVDFYCIVKRSGNWLTLLPMKKKTTPMDSYMCSTTVPGEVDYTAKPSRRLLKVFSGKESGLTIEYGWCNLWSGKPERESHYA